MVFTAVSDRLQDFSSRSIPPAPLGLKQNPTFNQQRLSLLVIYAIQEKINRLLNPDSCSWTWSPRTPEDKANSWLVWTMRDSGAPRWHREHWGGVRSGNLCLGSWGWEHTDEDTNAPRTSNNRSQGAIL